MKRIHFLFAIHNHQPVGNFEHVFSLACERSYKPFVRILEKYPSIKTTLHYSGPLLEWMETGDHELFDLLHELIDRRQVELMGGGMYEPVFSILRERDVIGQIMMMTDHIRNSFRTEPSGAWTAERVWDPVLPRLIRRTGLGYTLLDSTHFLRTGLSPEQIRGYYVTEREGSSLAVYPIDMHLRYTIPFEPPAKTIEYLQYRASGDETVAVTYGDDGEKFGLWPGTHAWVYEQGWLESFFAELEKNRHMIKMTGFSEYLQMQPPEGIIYLPTVSYEEMMEWSLPAEAIGRYDDMMEKLTKLGLQERYSQFLCGGYWNNFLAKYPESNNMHKKMIHISERLEAVEMGNPDPDTLTAARRELYQGQCNCPYWHGLFGGIYLNYLRHAVYEHLINAEKIIDVHTRGSGPWIEGAAVDFKRDLSSEVLVTGSSLNAYFSLRDGGSMFELDYKPRSFNLCNTLTRRMEGYHRKLKIDAGRGEGPSDQENQPVSIHHISKVKEEGLGNLLVYDWYQRYSFIDHFLGSGTTPDSFSSCRYSEEGDFVGAFYSLSVIETDADRHEVSFSLERRGHVLQHDQEMPIAVKKHFTINDAAQTVESRYEVTNHSDRALDLWLGIEFNVTLLAGEDPLRYYSFPEGSDTELYMNSREQRSSLERFELRDDWNGFGVCFTSSPATDVWVFPLETVSQSEDGLERTYQGSSLLLNNTLRLEPNRTYYKTIALRLFSFDSERLSHS